VQIEPLQEFDAERLATYDGRVADRPIYLAIQGKVYDVTAGSAFYGPQGAARGGAGAGRRAHARRAGASRTLQRRPALAAPGACYRCWRPKPGSGGGRSAPRCWPVPTGAVAQLADRQRGRAAAAAGVYPFAGQECARALALMSVDPSDCSGDLEGLGHTEKGTLRDWVDKFDFKYPVVGKVCCP
jgi:predicted heme/steroid binding protein